VNYLSGEEDTVSYEQTMAQGPQRPGTNLIMQQGPWPGRSFPMPRTSLLVGRAPDCDIVLDDVGVSRHHARLYWRGSRLVVEDLGSTNGTLVNSIPISGPQTLNEGDRVEVGDSVFGVQGLPVAAPPVGERTVVAPHRAAPAQPAAPPPTAPAEKGGELWLALGGLGTALVAGVVILILIIAAIWYSSRTPPGGPPVVTIAVPVNGAQVEVGVPVTVQAAAIDSKGVARLELWADGALVGQQTSPSPQGQSPLQLSLPWTPQVAGSHVLEVRAYNVDNRQSDPVTVAINAVAGGVAGATETPTPPPGATATATPPPGETPKATLPPQAALQAATVVNVRTGPGTDYPTIGQLKEGDTALVTGRSADGAWWQIVFPPNSNGLGWVSAAYAQANQQAAKAPIVSGPPLPPTNTSVPPTNTSVPPTATKTTEPPTPTSTKPPPGPIVVNFTADDTDLNEGECTKLRWHVENVTAYWVDGDAGAGDDGKKDVCDPVGTTTHILRIQKPDGSTQDFTVTITVKGAHAIHKQGQAILHGTYCFDIDEGAETDCTPASSDFQWQQVTAVERYLTPQNGAQMANMGSLSGANYDTCENASYSSNQINGSDNASNTIPAGTYVCVKTNGGRYAVFRVDVYGQDLSIGYTTWQ
jgi:uncharacterized protein YraI